MIGRSAIIAIAFAAATTALALRARARTSEAGAARAVAADAARGIAAPPAALAPLTPAERRRASTEDRVLVLAHGLRVVITAPIKDADEWDIVGVAGTEIEPWRGAASDLAWITLAAALSGALACLGVRRIARIPDARARVLVASACLALALGPIIVWRASGGTLAPPSARELALGIAFPSREWLTLIAALVALLGAAALGAVAWLASARRRPALVRDTITAWSFLAPALLHLAVFTIGPLAFALWISLHRWDLLDRVHPFIGLGNYGEMVHDPAFWNAVRNTAIYALYVPASMVLALGAAIVLDQRLRGIRLLRTIVFLPYVASVVAIAIVWQWMYNADYGVLNAALRIAHLPAIDWLSDPRTALLAVMIVSAWVQLGYQMVIYLAGLQGIPASLHEAARLDGASAWQRFRHITLPLLRPVTLYVLVTGIIWSFQVFTLVYVMTEGGPLHHTDVIVYQIYQNAWEFRRMGYASAMSWALFVLLLVLTVAQWKLLEGRVEYV